MPFAAALAFIERGEHAHRGHQPAACVVGDHILWDHWAPVGVANQSKSTSVPDVVEIVAGEQLVWPGLTKPCHRAIDDAFVELVERFVVDAESFHNAGSHLLHDDIGVPRERVKNLAGALVLEIEPDAALVAIQRIVLGAAPLD